MLVTRDKIDDDVKNQVNEFFAVTTVAPGVFQLLAPFYHADGDMIEIYIQPTYLTNNSVRLTDKGMTLMRLSYSEDINNPSVRKNVESIIRTQRLNFEDGEIYCECQINEIVSFSGYLAQSLSKVMSISAIDRQTKRSLFQQHFNEFVKSEFRDYMPIKDHNPLPKDDDYSVDFMLTAKNNKQLYLYSVNNSLKAKEAMTSFLFFQLQKLNFLGVVVYEDFDKVTSKDTRRLINIADKTYTDLEVFKESGYKDITRITA